MMDRKMERAAVLAALLLALLCACVCAGAEPAAVLTEPATDYSEASSWYQIPEITKEADTFYFYPTLYDGNGEDDGDYAAIDNADMLAAVGAVYQGQASAFEEATNVFVPYYRQASMAHEIAAYEETGSLDAALEDLPLEDALAALDYYFENYNDGRPFILAGHSQGAALMKLVLKTYFKEHPEYYDRMVAAYIIGYSVTQQDLDEYPYLKFATGETDTGVIISWNAVGQKHIDANAHTIVALERSIAINPLNWKRDDTYAPASENLGSLVLNFETGEMELSDIGADAQVNMELGVVVTHAHADPVNTMTEFFGPQSYHTGDYSLYYMNIRDNAARRVTSYIAGKD